MGVLSFRGDQAESGRRGAEGDLMACLDLWAVEVFVRSLSPQIRFRAEMVSLSCAFLHSSINEGVIVFFSAG